MPIKDPEKRREYMRRYFQEHREAYYEKNERHRRKLGQKPLVRTGLTKSEYKKKWVAENPEYRAKQSEYSRSPERVERRKELYRLESEEKRARRKCQSADRRARKAQASPPWLTDGDRQMIQAIYAMAERLSRCMGIPHDVDHIVPICGKNVCGLHVPWNLAVIPANVNRRKGNRYPSDQVRYQMEH